MIISSVQLFSYQIPLDKLLPVGRQRIDKRKGLVLQLEAIENSDETGSELKRVEQVEISPLSGLDVDANPLLGFSLESLDDASHQLSNLVDVLVGQHIDQLIKLADNSDIPSLAFGLSLLHAKLSGQLDGHNLSLQESKTVPLIYRVTDESKECFDARIRAIPTDIHAVKVKVAQTSLEDEIKLVHQILAIRPDIKLRLDANRGFTLEQAIEFAACLPLDAVEYIEEPCIDHKDNQKFFHAIPMPWALDETLNDPSYQFTMQPGLTALVIKPMLIGTLVKLQKLQHEAEHHGVRTILSSSLEASLGIEALAKLSRVMTPDEIPGLDTLSAFSKDLLINSGKAQCLKLSCLTEIKSV
ncbi:o-succinylbenzoate synthase [Shewanella eurypsychrophilus]|uniref:o-succinylbenzoate synthase n=1 Tax=Shewanella eurypsychrophilus TaxID=2593656 RepID=A0ABX6V6P8_9GAMM|nr:MULTISPECIES: o-succinylbenzoate synthase [Shewanella]QFU20634.1 o-succinylbenzoate synthase [Shewanella sp. YLB-09]QFU20914.1 o-succinylbenzoate synthase [Shewanella sp. YLB-09]QPG56202.1 o-succinylbenzoate synthase [Shewanella eurypsychrophilus]